MKIEQWNINDVKQFHNNARVHDEKSINAIKASIDRFSWTSPIVVDKNGVIIAGHGRLESAKQLGMEQVPVLVADWLTDNEVAAAREADNMTQDLSFFDWDKLNINLEEIDWLDIDMSEFGFKLDDKIEPIPDDLDAEETRNDITSTIKFYSYDDYKYCIDEIKSIVEDHGSISVKMSNEDN